MKKLATALILGSLVTSCSIESDPTKDTKYNFKNGVQKLSPDADIVQKSAGQCNKLFNVQIDNTYTFEPGNDSSNILVAHSLLNDLETELKLVQSDRNPPGLSLKKVPGEIGEYQFSWDTTQINTKKNYEVFYVELAHVAKGRNSIEVDGCAISNRKEVKLVYITDTKEIPISVSEQPLSDEGIVELDHDLNASNTFKVQLPKISSLKKYPLDTKVDSIDIRDFATITEKEQSGIYTITIDKEALAEEFKGQEEQELALSLRALADGVYAEEFQVHFKFISNIKIEETVADNTPGDVTATPAEGKQ